MQPKAVEKTPVHSGTPGDGHVGRGITVPKSRHYCREIAQEFRDITNTEDVVIKAQVLAESRGKGYFSSDLQGATEIFSKMIPHPMFTVGTGERNCRLNSKVMVCERVYSRREYYFAMLMDTKYDGPVMLASSQGGISIDEVVKTNPEAIITEPVDIMVGMKPEQADKVAGLMGFGGDQKTQAAHNFLKLYELFLAKDCTLIEANPIVEDSTGKVICMDCKINFDSNAAYRQKDVFAMNDWSQEDWSDVTAEKANIN